MIKLQKINCSKAIRDTEHLFPHMQTNFMHLSYAYICIYISTCLSMTGKIWQFINQYNKIVVCNKKQIILSDFMKTETIVAHSSTIVLITVIFVFYHITDPLLLCMEYAFRHRVYLISYISEYLRC